jgi:hypothetical protein
MGLSLLKRHTSKWLDFGAASASCGCRALARSGREVFSRTRSAESRSDTVLHRFLLGHFVPWCEERNYDKLPGSVSM